VERLLKEVLIKKEGQEIKNTASLLFQEKRMKAKRSGTLILKGCFFLLTFLFSSYGYICTQS